MTNPDPKQLPTLDAPESELKTARDLLDQIVKLFEVAERKDDQELEVYTVEGDGD